ncbi:MAG: iron-sulfur cluster insertion protein ErpA, partial [Actinomycetota bacterium]
QASSQLLVGASLDYQDGLTDAGFKINNPNATRTCGCGNSFS